MTIYTRKELEAVARDAMERDALKGGYTLVGRIKWVLSVRPSGTYLLVTQGRREGVTVERDPTYTPVLLGGE